MPRTSTHTRAETRARQVAALRARRLADLLALPDEALETSPRIADNPALERLGPRRRGDADAPVAGANDAADPDLLDELATALRLERLPHDVREAGLNVIAWLDDRGLLTTTPSALAARLGLPEDTVEAGRRAVAALDPPGCGATSIAEHLTWAVTLAWPEDPFFPTLVAHHLADLQAGRLAAPATALGLDPEDVDEYRRMLARVPPWPTWGRGSAAPAAATTTWTVFDCPITGRLRVRVEDDTIPRWRVSARYAERTRALPPGPERSTRERHLAEAHELVAALERRGSVCRQVVELAVARQQELLRHGPALAAPLRMSTVAQMLGVDASTVSRAVSGRWLATPRGPVALRDLFTWRNGGAEVSAPRLLDRLRALLAGEPPRRPLTDDELADALTREGIPVSRRTVARHRATLGIPGARQRGR